jgi:protein SCO1/2
LSERGFVVAHNLHRCSACGAVPDREAASTLAGTREFAVKGVVKKVEPENNRVLVAHEAIPDFMDAMTMPFRIKDPAELVAIKAGDSISFRLSVTEDKAGLIMFSKYRP